MRSAVVAVTMLALAAPTAMGNAGDSFERLIVPYEQVRQALLDDTVAHIAGSASEVARAAELMRQELVAVGHGHADRMELLSEITRHAHAVSQAAELVAAREAFASLSESLVRYRQILGDSSTLVVFCSMAQKVWLQSIRDIGNPYVGKGMASCGEIVSD